MTTTTDKGVLSEWQIYKITERIDATPDYGLQYSSDSVKVKYFDDVESEQEIEYDVNDFVQSANPDPIQEIDLTVRYDRDSTYLYST